MFSCPRKNVFFSSLFYLLLNMSLESFEPLFASIHHLCQPGGVREKNMSHFHKVKFCPELGISKICKQNRCHLWHIAHKFRVAFQCNYNSLGKILGCEKIGAIVAKLGVYVWGAALPHPHPPDTHKVSRTLQQIGLRILSFQTGSHFLQPGSKLNKLKKKNNGIEKQHSVVIASMKLFMHCT